MLTFSPFFFPQGWMVRADRAGLRRVLTNLYSNSLKYTTEGSIVISLREAAASRPSPPSSSSLVKVEICVADSGKGISKAFQKQLFLPFSQEDVLQPGAGLGKSFRSSAPNSSLSVF